MDFNSHAHVERDGSRLAIQFDIAISTHTLTWSVTNSTVAPAGTVSISTHTLTWSVTYQHPICEVFKDISTHTLTWSVT